MFTVSIDPIIFSVGHFMVRWYSLIIVAAILVGLWVSSREAARRGMDKEIIYDLAVWLIPAGILGARLFHVLDHWDHEYAAAPWRAFYIWQGGLAIWGAVVGGVVALLVLCRRKGWPLLPLMDTFAPGLVLAQGIGRLACVITGDAMGKPTAGPFGFAYTNPNALVPQLGVYYTPTPIYELLMNVGVFAVLWSLRPRPRGARRWARLPDGALFLIYLSLYSAGRFVITFWSSYRTFVFGLNQAQIISLAALAVGMPLLIYVLLRNRQSHASA